MTIAWKKSGGGYTGAYLMGKGRKEPTKAARVNVAIKAFIEAFVNGRWTWTRYFCAALLENKKVGHAARIRRIFNTRNNGFYGRPVSNWCVSPRGPSFSLNLGASRRALSECLWTGAKEPSVKVSEKDVLQKIGANPQAA